jgi:phage terminase small subunit
MSGVKGKSGGARPGSGPKPKPPVLLKIKPQDCEEPLEFLLAVMRDPKAPADLRVRSAISASQYVHTRTKDGGKNVVKTEKSKEAARGRFAPGEPPKLAVVNNGGA